MSHFSRLLIVAVLVAVPGQVAQGRDWSEPAKITNSKATDYSKETLEVLGLFDNLLHFGAYPKFQQVGFGTCCEFNAWSKRIGSLSSKGRVVYDEIGVLPSDVWGLAVDYMKNRGRPKEARNRKVEQKLTKALRATGHMGVSSHAELVLGEIEEYVIRPCVQYLAPRIGVGERDARRRLAASLRQFTESVRAQAEGQPVALRNKLYEIGLRLCKSSG